ncbi:MAG: MerR family transcriptional regulator [Proteobacteria bacterium]|nr:MerR family transcriptional regulator [Pseudomonadota bacterium]MCH8176921.1 MerR family transcriptional regulator [Pseudomonadota bacterium]
MKKSRITISKAAERAGVGIETIRYYQRLGLIEEPGKPVEGYRLYPEQTIAQIQFIKRAQELGFTLKEIMVLMELGEKQCLETRELAGLKLELVQKKIRDLRSIEHNLRDLIQHCEARKDDEACPIIFSISQQR